MIENDIQYDKINIIKTKIKRGEIENMNKTLETVEAVHTHTHTQPIF